MKTPAQLNLIADHRRRRAIIETAGRTSEAQRRRWQEKAGAIAEAVAWTCAAALLALFHFYR
jgi:hypothetical protein